MLERLGGRVIRRARRRRLPGGKVEEHFVEETEGGILHWGRESGPALGWFRERIREVYGRAPRILDPFAGGGSIPLEAMRLGCEATAVDINPVAWFILKCTLEYPQKLAGQTRPLPPFVLEWPEFVASFVQAGGDRRRARDVLAGQIRQFDIPEADLSWHVRAWGRWVLERAREDLERFYPTVDGKPTVAYLWARTVKCKNCRALLPLLKTRWLCRKPNKRVVLTMEPGPDRSGVVFGIKAGVPVVGVNAAQRRAHDRRIGAGTMSRAGATCPCCGTVMTMLDIRMEGQAGRLGAVMTAVVVEGQGGKEYRLPTQEEIGAAGEAAAEVERVFGEIPMFDSVLMPRLTTRCFRPYVDSTAKRLVFVAIARAVKWAYLSTVEGQEPSIVNHLRGLEKDGIIAVRRSGGPGNARTTTEPDDEDELFD